MGNIWNSKNRGERPRRGTRGVVGARLEAVASGPSTRREGADRWNPPSALKSQPLSGEMIMVIYRACRGGKKKIYIYFQHPSSSLPECVWLF